MKAIFVDVDGVVMRSRRALGVFDERIVRWVGAQIKSPTFVHAIDANREAYSTHGHTYTGIKRMFPSCTATLEDFNDFVYSPEAVQQAFDIALSDSATAQNRADLEGFLAGCAVLKIPVFMLTNAPRSWAIAALSSMAKTDLKASGLFCSDDPAARSTEWSTDDPSILKPSIRSFSKAAWRAVKCGEVNGENPSFYLVDDSKTNCSFARNVMGWGAFEFDQDKHSLSTDVLAWAMNDFTEMVEKKDV